MIAPKSAHRSVERRHHIAIYIPSLRGGGAERAMVTLANGFAAVGYRTDLVLTRAEGPYLSDVATNVRIIDLNKSRVFASLLPLSAYLRRERPTAMVSALSHANIVAIIARRLARVRLRLVVSERGAPRETFAGGGKTAIARMMARCLYPKADAIVCVSNGMAHDLQQLFNLPPNKLFTVYNPIDIERIKTLMNEPLATENLLDFERPLVCAVGRLNSLKDYPNLLRAFALLLKRRSAHLVILGHGEEEEPLRQLAQELGITCQVAFLGFQRNPYAWMKISDLYVLSSRSEGLPNALLEALVSAPRVISTDCPTGPKEILEDGKWGRLVRVGDAEALAQAMDAALDDDTPPDLTKRAEAFRPERALEGYARAMGLDESRASHR